MKQTSANEQPADGRKGRKGREDMGKTKKPKDGGKEKKTRIEPGNKRSLPCGETLEPVHVRTRFPQVQQQNKKVESPDVTLKLQLTHCTKTVVG